MSRPVFDLGGPLPQGLGVLEASAGTGKTYALSALAVRYIAEADVPASALCIVSFTEAATAELRGRVRARLVEVADHLTRGEEPGDDPVLRALAAGSRAEIAARTARLQRAVNDFDAATISTIHGLCRRALAMVGSPSEGVITDGLAEIDEVVNDVFLSHFGRLADRVVKPDRLAQVVRLRLAMPDATMFTPVATKHRSDEHTQQAIAAVDAAVAEVLRRRAARRRRTFDSLLTETREALRGPLGPALVSQLRDRFQVVLIDEFQDTDRVQWDIFSTAFCGQASPTTVVLVGDPKQSIYRFRSADLGAYLGAVGTAGDEVWSLGTNWRSDGPLLDGLATVFDGVTFGDERVPFSSVGTAPGHEHAALGSPSIEIREVRSGATTAPEQRRVVSTDVVRTVVSLLAAPPQIEEPGGGRRPLRARDIAVLTRSNVEAATVSLALAAAGVPAASSSNQSVIETDAARQWQILLRALERPGSIGASRAAALGWFIGLPAAELALLDDDGVSDLHDLLVRWSRALDEGGVPRLLALARAGGLHSRLLDLPGGERMLTDLDHIAELLQSLTGGTAVGATALLAVLRSLADPAGEDALAPELLARRIDRDDDAVQVLTVHKSKGLEFSVVLCPFLWTTSQSQGPRHAAIDGGRVIDTAWLIDSRSDARGATLKPWDSAEKQGEARRLLYVALTRARHRLVVWLPTEGKVGGPLYDILSAACGRSVVDGGLVALDGAAGGSIAVRLVDPDAAVGSLPVADATDQGVCVAVADRVLTHRWRSWSFSAVKADADRRLATDHHGDEPLDRAEDTRLVGGVDESGAEHVVDDTDVPEDQASPTRLATAPGGTSFGTMVHQMLEHVDFTSADLVDDLAALAADWLPSRRLAIEPVELAEALVDALGSPLGGPEPTRRLIDVMRRDRLDELDFHLPLAGIGADRIGAVLAAHLPEDDPFTAWAASLADQGYDIDVEGMLVGSIDLVARTSDGRRFWLADYKTNQLGPTCAYTRDDIVAAMTHHHYPLQATLYLVALHRYLRWRVPGYDADDHLVGASYLFLRGMRPAAPGSSIAATVPGVLWWRPPTAALLAVDRLLATGESS